MSNTIKLIIIGALIIAVPVTVKLVQQQQILKSRAASTDRYACEAPDQIKVGTPQGKCGTIEPGKQCFSRYIPDSIDENGQRWCDNSNCVPCTGGAASTTQTPAVPAGAPNVKPYLDSDGNSCIVPIADGPNKKCSDPLPNESYQWVLMPNPVNADLYGANNACGGVDAAAANAVCPQNITDCANVKASSSNWCYEFTEGNRCIRLHHKGTDGSGGDCGGGGVGNCSATVEDARQQLIKSGGPFQNSSCAEVTAEVCSNCKVFVPPNAIRTALCPAGSCGGSLPNPNPGSTDPKGWLDAGATCNAIKGWTCDGDDYATSLRVDFFADGPVGQGVGLGNATANLTREAAVGQQCGGNSSHGFSFAVPANSLRDGKPHNIYAYGINAGSSGTNQLLQGAPQSVTCTTDTPTPPSPPKPPPVSSPSNRIPGDADDNKCVNVDDYTIWKQEAGVGGTKKCANWTSENPSTVDTEDYGIWYRAWKVLTNRQGCITPPAGSRCIDK